MPYHGQREVELCGGFLAGTFIRVRYLDDGRCTSVAASQITEASVEINSRDAKYVRSVLAKVPQMTAERIAKLAAANGLTIKDACAALLE